MQTAVAIEPLLTVEELAAYLRVSRQQVYALKHAGRIPFLKVGGLLRFRKSEIDARLEEQRAGSISRATFQSPFQSAKARLRSLTTEKTETSSPTSRLNGRGE